MPSPHSMTFRINSIIRFFDSSRSRKYVIALRVLCAENCVLPKIKVFCQLLRNGRSAAFERRHRRNPAVRVVIAFGFRFLFAFFLRFLPSLLIASQSNRRARKNARLRPPERRAANAARFAQSACQIMIFARLLPSASRASRCGIRSSKSSSGFPCAVWRCSEK
jgi:hypothetical protein